MDSVSKIDAKIIKMSDETLSALEKQQDIQISSSEKDREGRFLT